MAALKGALIDQINDAVKDGRITQAQANTLEQRINQGQLPLGFGARRFRRSPLRSSAAHGGHGFGEPRFRNIELDAAAGYLGLTDAQLIDQLARRQVARAGREGQGQDDRRARAGDDRGSSRRGSTRPSPPGRITQSQEQTILNRFQSRLDKRVNDAGRSSASGTAAVAARRPGPRRTPEPGGPGPGGRRTRRPRTVGARPRRPWRTPGRKARRTRHSKARRRHHRRPDSYRALKNPFGVSHWALL